MIRSILRVIESLSVRPRRSILILAVSSFVAGLVDGLLVILAVRMALEAADVKVNPVRLPVVGVALSDNVTIAMTIALAITAALLHLLTTANATRFAAVVLAAARRRAYLAHVRARWSHQQSERQGSLQETVTMAYTVAESAQAMADLINASLMVVTILALGLVISAVSVAVIAVFAIAVTLALRPLGHRVGRESRRSRIATVRLAEELAEVATVSRELRAFGVYDSVGARLDGLNEASAHANRRSQFLVRYVWMLHSDVVVMFLVVAVSVIYGSRTSQFVGISTVALLVARALGSANQLQQSRNRLDDCGPTVESYDERVSALEAEAVQFGDRELQPIHVLRLEEVTHEYVAGVPVLRSVDLEVRRGESVGLIGPSGAGKTTISEIVSRLRAPTTGSVMVDGHRVDDFTEISWAGQVAIVPQEPHLIEGTVRENIRFHRDWIDDETVVEAARAAHVLHEIERLPDGFDTMLGPRGVGVSVGQKQRLAIARALADRPSLLVLDEPTSALDPRSERKLRETLDDLHGTIAVLMVTHRMSTVDVCDRLVVVDGGRIVASGSVGSIMGDPALHDLTRATLLETGTGERVVSDRPMSGNASLHG